MICTYITATSQCVVAAINPSKEDKSRKFMFSEKMHVHGEHRDKYEPERHSLAFYLCEGLELPAGVGREYFDALESV